MLTNPRGTWEIDESERGMELMEREKDREIEEGDGTLDRHGSLKAGEGGTSE